MKHRLPILLSVTALLTSCSGSNPTSTTSLGTSLSGIAATGAPVSGGTVDIKGSNGVVVSTTTSSTGAYQKTLTGLTEPYLILVTTPTGEKLISVASDRDVEQKKSVNVTPLSHTIVANVFHTKDADELFDHFTSHSNDYSDAKLDEKKIELRKDLINAGVISSTGVMNDANVDFMNGTFVAGSGAGMDKLLDALDINTTTGTDIEIKFKGSAFPIINNNVTTSVNVVTAVNPTALTAITAQLSALDEIKTFYKNAAGTFASFIPCNGAAVSGGACDKDTLASQFGVHLHTNYLDDGGAKASRVWDFFCKETDTEEGHSAHDSASCHFINAFQVSFSDVTIVHFNPDTGEATVSMNMYKEGKLKGTESEVLKKEGGAWKFFGNQRRYRFEIQAQSMHRSQYNLSGQLDQTQEKFAAQLGFYVDDRDSSSAGLVNATGISLTAVNPDNTAKTLLNAALGSLAMEKVNNRLVISSQKFFDYQTGAIVQSCTSTTDPQYHCGQNFNASVIDLTPAALELMDQRQKFKLVYNDGSARTEYLYVNKPLRVTATNAANFLPDFTSSSICTTPASSYSVMAPAGTELEHGNASISTVASSTYTNYQGEGQFEGGQQGTVTMTGSPAGSLANAFFYLSARDNFNRSFVRLIECRQNQI